MRLCQYDAAYDFIKEHLLKIKIDQLITDCRDNKIILHDK
jgi:NADH-quinone oxidoreductase subunit E